ncbi:MAG: HDOD domain-containing protein [bacterium]
MIIQCPACSKSFSLQDNQIPENGINFPCPSCRHTFVVIKNAISLGLVDKESDQKRVSEVKVKDRLDDAFKKKIVSLTGDLPPMPHIAMKVMEIVRDVNVSANGLKKVISQDQALTAKILKFSNSALYSCVRTISTLTDAIVVLGFNTIRSLVIATSTQSLYKKESKKSGLTEQKLWEHSVATAITAKLVAEKVHFTKLEEAFVCGLLHDIGKLILVQSLFEKYNEVIQEVYNEGSSFIIVEEKKFGFDHTDVGALVVKKWNFALELEEAIHYHHYPEKASVAQQLAYIIAFANLVCVKLKIGLETSFENDIAFTASAKFLGLSAESICDIEKRVQTTILNEKDLFNL